MLVVVPEMRRVPVAVVEIVDVVIMRNSFVTAAGAVFMAVFLGPPGGRETRP